MGLLARIPTIITFFSYNSCEAMVLPQNFERAWLHNKVPIILLVSQGFPPTIVMLPMHSKGFYEKAAAAPRSAFSFIRSPHQLVSVASVA